MANLANVLKSEIARIARREARDETKLLKKQSAQYRRDIADLKRQVASLQRKATFLEKQEKKRVESGEPAKAPQGARFRAAGLKSHRAKLGLSAADYAALVGCSPLSIYNWESGKTKPGSEQVAKLLEVRSYGVREAQHKLELIN